MQTAILRIEGMTCASCVASVQRVLRGLDGVENAEVSLEQATATVQYEPARVKPADLQAAIEDAGYDVLS